MPYTLPISESLDLSVVAAVEQVSVANSYQITLSSVVRWDPDNPPTPADLMAIVSFESDDPAKDNDTPVDDSPIGFQGWYRHYSVNVYLMKPPDAPMTTMTWQNLVRAEIEKAVFQDRQRNNFAEDTGSLGMSLFMDANDATGITIHFVCKYRTNENDPYNRG